MRLLHILLLAFLPWAVPGANIRVEVDARDMSRQLLHSTLELSVKSGEQAIWYPKWVPGTHSPGGPVQNIGGLRFETPDGEPISWKRDPTEPYRLLLNVPSKIERITARLDYICSQPTANSSGIDSFGNNHVGIINWNTCVLYPEGHSIDDLTVEASLRIPEKWKFGTSLATASVTKEAIVFEPLSLRHFVDSPIIFGEHFRSIPLKSKKFEETYLHLTSEAPSAIQIDDQLIAQYRKLVDEAIIMFGAAHFSNYHFLVVCSDQMPRNGLEHLSSSFNVVAERELIDDKQRKDWPAYLLPHEFVHSWCGKFRRPVGMVSPDFHTPEKTALLWVYEGLAQYLGEVLTVRSGLIKTSEYLDWMASTLSHLQHQVGRQWRPLEDTATASHLLRGGSQSWGHLRRSQDYYAEGLLVWLEADAIIRQRSDGKKSLDDFCRDFMGRDSEARSRKGVDLSKAIIAPYELSDVISALEKLADHDWKKFFAERVEQSQKELPLSVVGLMGYRLQYETKPSDRLEYRERERKQVSALDSIGISATSEGKITAVVPGMAADKAGIAPGMAIQGINDRKFSPQRLKDAVADSIMNRKVDLLVLQGESFKTISIPYSDGLKYLKLVRNTQQPDTLSEILKPRLGRDNED